jgi:hypothetical protein
LIRKEEKWKRRGDLIRRKKRWDNWIEKKKRWGD